MADFQEVVNVNPNDPRVAANENPQHNPGQGRGNPNRNNNVGGNNGGNGHGNGNGIGGNIINPNHPPRRPNTVGEGDTANIHQDTHGIHAPPIGNNNFEVKTSLVNMVQGNRFYGLPSEDPLDHIHQFNRVCGLIKMGGVSEDALKLRLFPFSLGDKAHLWEKNLPYGTITTWEDCKREFLNKFFSLVRTAKLRNEISSFKQLSNESFNEAWERFKGLQYQCPHHGFSDATLLSTLYRGTLPKFRQLLDTASNGSFLAKDVTEAMDLVENLATSDGTYGDDYARASRTTSDHDEATRSKDIKGLTEKLDKQSALIDKLLASSKKETTQEIKYIDYDGNELVYQEDDMEWVGDEEVNFVGNQTNSNQQGFNNNYRQHPNLSYRSNNVANPNDQSYPPRVPQPNQGGPPQQGQPATAPRQQGSWQPRSNQAPPGFQQNRQGYGQQGSNQRQQGYNQQGSNQRQQGYNQQGYANQQGYGQQMWNQGQQGYNQAPQAQAPTQPSQATPDLASMMQQMLLGQSALSTKIESMETKIKHLESKEASSSRQNQLPGKAEANPREYINAIELRSGTTLPTRENPHLNEDIETQKKGG